MTLAGDISTTSTSLSDIKNAIIAKGVTPSGNITTYAAAISDIPTGGIGITREVKNGVYQMPTENFTFSLPNDANNVGSYGLSYAFYGCSGLTSADLSSLTTVSGDYGLYFAFYDCITLTSVDLSSLTTVSGSYGLSSALQGCTGLTSIDLSSLTTVSGGDGLSNAFRGCSGLTSIDLSSLTTVSNISSAFNGCTGLTTIDLSSLTTVSGSNCFRYAFSNCSGLTDIYFRALTTSSFAYTNQFNNMMQNSGTTVTHTIHFPSNMQSTISGLTGYPLFGGTSGYVVLAFDLPATS